MTRQASRAGGYTPLSSIAVRRYDMLVIDLDGTLLDRTGTVSPRNARAVQAARDSGMEVVIATGRSLSESRDPLLSFGHTGYVITAGGAMLCDAATSRTLRRRVMPPEVVREVTGWLHGDDHPVLILKDADRTGYDYLIVGDAPLDPASDWWFSTMPATVRRIAGIDEDPHPDDSVRAAAVSCRSRLEPLAMRLQRLLGERCALQHWSAVTATHAIGSTTHLLEVFQCAVSKWSMVQQLCQDLGIMRERVASIGDGLNDLDLITCSGLGIAMGNASNDVFAAASRVTGHHDRDGVADAIEHILSGAW